jgi:hypothetical protein
VYLIKREAKELFISIAGKYNFEPTQPLQIVGFSQKGLNIKIDNDFIQELPEGQAMILELSRITATPIKRKWVKAVETILDRERVSPCL